jgi:1,4-alpha-glucan branching enzyme
MRSAFHDYDVFRLALAPSCSERSRPPAVGDGLARPAEGRGNASAPAEQRWYGRHTMEQKQDDGTVQVTFRLPSESGAERAWVVGEFNNWSTDSHPMTKRLDGAFEVVIPLAPGTYRFRYYLGDGRWENAWDADSYAANEFGGSDSVVIVRPSSNGHRAAG